MHHIENDPTNDPLEPDLTLSKPSPTIDPLLEQQLQQELLSLFEVDSQRDLEAYLQGVQTLTPENWQDSITQLYRAIHTIKGGAVTVHAEVTLTVATILEDVLSDLRYLEAIPDLSDGKLCSDLQEAGELLAVALTIPSEPPNPKRAEPLVLRIEELRHQIQSNHAQAWDAEAQLRQEFIRDGFDLVVLDLEREVQQLNLEQTTVPQATLEIAGQVLAELEQIGQELAMPDAWNNILDNARGLRDIPNAELWQTQWPILFDQFKACISSPGSSSSLPSTNLEIPQPEIAVDAASEAWLEPSDSCLESLEFLSNLSQSLVDSGTTLADAGTTIPQETPSQETPSQETPSQETRPQVLDTTASDIAPKQAAPKQAAPKQAAPKQAAPKQAAVEQPAAALAAQQEASIPEVIEAQTRETAKTAASPSEPAANVHIPIALERLEASAESIVETIQSARTVTDSYQALQKQLRRILALAENSTDFVTHLRQLQDDYAILDTLKAGVAQQLGTPKPERYRKGYVTINRLLEMTLRLSELGAEAEQVSQQTSDALQQLDHNLAGLKNNIEQNQLVPFKNLAFRARAIVRDLMNRTQKPVEFTLEGESLEIDVATLRQLEPALLHLLRNAFEHGLETAEERMAAGKSPKGMLHLSLQRQGHRLLLSLRDDGRGIDQQAIAQRAQLLGLPITQAGTTQEILPLLCQPGFSSQTQVSEFSGRGVGMDVVAAQVARLGGVLDLNTQLGQGTTFILSLPLPRLLEPCLVVQTGEHPVAIPTSQIGMIQMVDQLELVAPSDRQSSEPWQVKTSEGNYDAFNLLTYWRFEKVQHPLAATAIAIQIPASDTSNSFYLLADKLIGQQELALQTLPTPLVSPSHLLGLSLQPNGQLMPILDCSQGHKHSSMLGQSPAAALPPGLIEPPNTEAQILVVDDAALIRRRLTVSLQAAGYRVASCEDGLEAWNWLCSHPAPGLVITDVEMPYLDGFSLIKRCRDAGMNYPILVSSSRLAEEWSREAERVGATDFLTKGFSTTQLLEKVQTLLAIARPSPANLPSPAHSALPPR